MRSKNSILTYTFIFSIGFHLLGFLLLKVKVLEALEAGSYVEVDFIETRWAEPLMELPGKATPEEDFLEPPEELFSMPNLGTREMIRSKNQALELPVSRTMEPGEVVIPKLDEARSDEHHPNRTGNVRESQKLIQGPAARRGIVFQKNPEYPAWAEQYGLEFEMRVKFWVLPNGEVGLVVVEDSTGYSEVDAEVVRAMKLWKFSPLEEGNKEIEWGSLLFKFRLKK